MNRISDKNMVLLTDSWKVDVLALLVGAFTVLYLITKRTYSYWDRKGFKTYSGSFNYIVGHLSSVFTQKEGLVDFIQRVYKTTKQPFIGIYSIFRPILFVRDTELIRLILIKDFNNFTDRGVHCNEGYDPLSGHLFALPGKIE